MNTKDEEKEVALISVGSALSYADEIRKLSVSINNRHPLYLDNKGTPNTKNPGKWRKETTYEQNAIIPIQANIQLDGISGLLPLQMFKIHPDKLPIGYQASSIAFIQKEDTHKITAGQDWTTEIMGQLVFLDDTPPEGMNVSKDTPKGFDINSLGSAEDITTNADALRTFMRSYGHVERDYSKGSKKREGYFTGELSSNGDIDPRMVTFMKYFIEAMNSNNVIDGFEHALTNLKVEFTSGNDVFHRKFYPNSQHVKGLGIDFILKAPATNVMLNELCIFCKKIKDTKYSNLYWKDEYRYEDEFVEGSPEGSYQRKEGINAHFHLQLNY